MANFELEGRVTIITGEPGVINTEVALEFAKAGATVVSAGPERPPSDALVRQIREQDGEAVAIPTDLVSHREVNNLIAETVKRYGRLDVMVNNLVSISYADGESNTSQMSGFAEDLWNQYEDFSLAGTSICCMAASKQMVKQQSGNLINIAMMTGTPDSVSHHLAWSVKELSKVFAYKWASANVNVNCIVPGFLREPGTKPPETNEDRHPDRRFGRTPTAQDVAALARFLASPAASMITGETIQVRSWSEAGRFDTQPKPAQNTEQHEQVIRRA